MLVELDSFVYVSEVIPFTVSDHNFLWIFICLTGFLGFFHRPVF
jgi:hypothetical protein